MPVQYTSGDATRPDAPGNKVIGHVCNDRGGWGRGFVLTVLRRWPEPERDYRSWSRTSSFTLGAVQLVQVQPDIWVANMVAQHGYRTSSNPVPLRYDALDTCLTTLADHAVELDASVHLPRIGTGLAGGSWDRIADLLDRRLTARGITTTIYDLP